MEFVPVSFCLRATVVLYSQGTHQFEECLLPSLKTFATLLQVSRKTFWRLQHRCKCHEKLFGVCNTVAKTFRESAEPLRRRFPFLKNKKAPDEDRTSPGALRCNRCFAVAPCSFILPSSAGEEGGRLDVYLSLGVEKNYPQWKYFFTKASISSLLPSRSARSVLSL